ncbi:MAG: bifunctional adenosylcobinamide kinase/adenosylcobinamide-phosphate guanylyltransferase [Litoreibacter sp.]
MRKTPSLSMIIGGASSGKSSFAERHVLATPGPWFYLATAQAFDDEMRLKIATHQENRRRDGWQTIEETSDISSALDRIPGDASVLLDCATMWLNNVMLAELDVAKESTRLLDTLANARQRITVVTNEVGLGIVPENALARRFRIAQGELNAQIAAQSTLVVAVMAGLPLVLKGQMR